MPGELGDDAVDAVGLGVDRDVALRSSLGDPAVERRFVGDGLVLRTVDLDLLRARARATSNVAGLRSIAAMTSLRTVAPVLGEPPPTIRLSSVLKPWSSRNSCERLRRNALERQILERLRKRRIAHQPDQFARQPRIVGMLDEVLLELGLVDLLDAGEHGFDAAILLDQLVAVFGPIARNAGNIVDAVAHQSEHFADLLRRRRRTSR